MSQTSTYIMIRCRVLSAVSARAHVFSAVRARLGPNQSRSVFIFPARVYKYGCTAVLRCLPFQSSSGELHSSCCSSKRKATGDLTKKCNCDGPLEGRPATPLGKKSRNTVETTKIIILTSTALITRHCLYFSHSFVYP